MSKEDIDDIKYIINEYFTAEDLSKAQSPTYHDIYQSFDNGSVTEDVTREENDIIKLLEKIMYIENFQYNIQNFSNFLNKIKNKLQSLGYDTNLSINSNNITIILINKKNTKIEKDYLSETINKNNNIRREKIIENNQEFFIDTYKKIQEYISLIKLYFLNGIENVSLEDKNNFEVLAKGIKERFLDIKFVMWNFKDITNDINNIRFYNLLTLKDDWKKYIGEYYKQIPDINNILSFSEENVNYQNIQILNEVAKYIKKKGDIKNRKDYFNIKIEIDTKKDGDARAIINGEECYRVKKSSIHGKLFEIMRKENYEINIEILYRRIYGNKESDISLATKKELLKNNVLKQSKISGNKNRNYKIGFKYNTTTISMIAEKSNRLARGK